MRVAVTSLAAVVVGCALIMSISASADDGVSGRAQNTGRDKTTDATESAPHRVEESQPSLYYLKDKRGTLQAVPNFSLEDFEDLYKLKHQLTQGDRRPRYSLQQMSATGTVVSAAFAEVSLQFRILVREDQWTRVPLRLDDAVLREPAQYEGKGENFLHYEGDGEGYVAWIRGQAGQQHQVTLKMLVPLATVGEETRMRLWVPRSTASELKLKVPLPGAMAKVSEGATLQTASSSKNETELTVVGLGGDFELSWFRSGVKIAEVPTVLEAFGNVSARIDSRGIDAEATLSVRSYGAPFDRFRVRLPQEAELVPGNSTGYTVAAVEESQSGGLKQRVVEVRLSKRTTGPVEVHLATNRATDALKPGTWLDLAGFEVVGAARQWGTIAISAVGDWQVLWGPSRGVRQIDQLPEALRRKDVVAGFDYFVQPYSLTVRLVPRKTRINVEPEYLVLVESDQIRLDAKLRYTVRGAKVYALEVSLPDWQLDEIGPDGLVAVDGVPTGTAGPTLSIPLAQPSVGQFELRIRAHRPLTADSKTVSVTLPQPQASAPASALVVVSPADNIELIPNSKGTVGLLRQPGTAAMDLPPRQQEPLVYRSEAARAMFSASLRRHAQRISVDIASQVNLDGAGGTVQQKFAYQIAHEPTDHVTLTVPRALAGPGRIELKVDDQSVTPIAMTEESSETSKTMPLRVVLPKVCIGACELTARYALEPLKISTEKRTQVDVPLVMPEEGELTGNKVSISASPELRVESHPGIWQALDAGLPRAGQRRGLQLSTSRRCGQIELEVQSEPGSETSVVVERACVQTWLTGPPRTSRQDRAVFQFTSRRREIEVTLPIEAALDQLYILLDGKRLTVPTTAEGSLVVPLASDGITSRHLLDLRYHFATPRSPLGTLSIEFPKLGSDVWIRRMYWQLVLPRGEHIISPPDAFTGEYRWGWCGYFWGRQPLLDQAQLENWVGVRSSAGSVPSTANCYLFSSLGRVEQCQLWTAGRTAVVSIASGIALLVGLLLIYFPMLRHPASLLVATVVLAALGVLYPESAILGAQAATLGLLLSLAAALLAHGLGRRRREIPMAERVTVAAASPGRSVQGRTTAMPAGSSTLTQVAPPSAIPLPPDVSP